MATSDAHTGASRTTPFWRNELAATETQLRTATTRAQRVLLPRKVAVLKNNVNSAKRVGGVYSINYQRTIRGVRVVIAAKSKVAAQVTNVGVPIWDASYRIAIDQQATSVSPTTPRVDSSSQLKASRLSQPTRAPP